MASDANFGLTDEHVVYELAAVLHFYLLDILGYGFYTCVYFVSLYLTLSRGCERPRIGPAVLITAIWVLVTIHASITWVRLDMIYIRHGGSRESQLASLFLSRSGDFVPLRATDTVVTFISLVLADIAMIWRCWVLYCRRWLVVIIPGLSLVAGSVCFIWRARIIMDFAFALNREIDKLSSLELIFLSTTVITNIFCTIAIIYRIVAVSGWRKSLKTYWRLIEILIESSLLYTAVYVIRIGLQIHTQSFTEGLDERVLFPRALGYSIAGIAPTLVIARVAAGFARPDDSWTRTSLPHMESAPRSLAESLHFARPGIGTVVDSDIAPFERGTGSEGVNEGLRSEEDSCRSAQPKSDKKTPQVSLQELQPEAAPTKRFSTLALDPRGNYKDTTLC